MLSEPGVELQHGPVIPAILLPCVLLISQLALQVPAVLNIPLVFFPFPPFCSVCLQPSYPCSVTEMTAMTLGGRCWWSHCSLWVSGVAVVLTLESIPLHTFVPVVAGVGVLGPQRRLAG